MDGGQNARWGVLLFSAAVLAILYLASTLFPGQVGQQAFKYFTVQQIEAGRAYSEPARLAYILSFVAQGIFLIWFITGGRAVALAGWAERATRLNRIINGMSGGRYWGSVLLFAALLWLILQVIKLPFSLYSSFILQHQWGFSTQGIGSWWLDYLKGSGLDLLLTGFGALAFFWLTRRWPQRWWIAGEICFSVWLFVQTFLWPVLFAPLFNKFVQAKDQAVVTMVQELAHRAGVPVDQVLIMDASQRTTKANAYFAGLGRTKQIVLYDNLLRDYPPGEVKAVVAHEIAHWRQGHIMKGLLLGIVGSFVAWGIMYWLLNGGVPRVGAWPVHIWALVILAFSLISFVSNPVQNYFSRQMETEADSVSIMLTQDAPTAVRLQIDLAAKSAADVQPPPFIEWFSYTHPSTLERIANFERAIGNNGVTGQKRSLFSQSCSTAGWQSTDERTGARPHHRTEREVKG